jgi:hypothetical protein
MSKENDQDFELLLNGYLDGELSESHAHKVEKRLAQDSSARELLAELKQVANRIGGLEREMAPDYLGQDILFELERNQLMTPHDSGAEQAGKNHLFLRRFVAAAALMFLAGVVGTIIYQVLFSPVGPVNRESATVVKELMPLVEKSADLEPLLASEDSVSGSVETLIDETTLKLGSIELEVIAQSVPAEGMIENLLGELAIERVMQISINASSQQYAFVCRIGQLADVFAGLRNPSDHQVRVLIKDSENDRQVALVKVDESELLQLAVIAVPEQQFAFAHEFMSHAFEPEQAITHQWVSSASALPANENEATYDMGSGNFVADWLGDAWVKNEPEITHLELLGPVDWPQKNEPQTRQAEGFLANRTVANNHPEDPSPLIALPEIETGQMVAVLLTYKTQGDPSDNNSRLEINLDPNRAVSE